MKTKAFLIATLLFAAGLYSCSDENNENTNSGGEDKGQPTYLDVSFSFPKGDVVTRAATTEDNNASLLEAAVNTVDVYIFNSNTGMMSKHQALAASDFVQQIPGGGNADVWKAKATIGTTTGAKTVFIGINLPTTFAQGLKNTSLANFNDNVHSLTMGQLVTGDGVAMFSANGVTSELKPQGDPDYGTNNTVKIPVKRLVAKVTVEKSSTMTINGPGKIDNLAFAINNINTKFFLVPKADGSDPNYLPHSWLSTDFINAVNTPDAPGDGYVKVNEANVPLVKDLNTLYTTENTSVNHWKEEITRATIRATFVPNKVTQKNGSEFVEIANPNLTPKTFWTVILQNGYRYYFLDENTATAFKNANPGSIKPAEYTNGYCYYDMFLNKQGYFNGYPVTSKKWDVFRNDYYRCRITSIFGPGRPDVPPLDPQTPPDTETDIKYEVDILFWNVVTDDYDLEP